MQSNASRNTDPRSSVSSGGERKQVRKVHARKIPYRVGYSWNKGGRLKELRIRHLARKFLKIWMQNTFGRILPHKAKSHCNSVVLRRAFEGWRDEWWTSRREWSLSMRAECHYRYYLYNLAFHSWRTFISLRREKKSKVQNAQSFAERQRMRLVWERWVVFTEMRRMENKTLESALEQNRLATLHSVWSLWRTRLQRHQDLHTLEAQALKQRALTLQSRTWLRWKEMHTAACCRKDEESKAALHFILRLKRDTLHRWKCYVSSLQTKKTSQAMAQRACDLRLLMTCWSKWSSALHRKQSEEDRLRAAGHLATRSIQRRAMERWKAYVSMCREEDEINRIARQHHHHHLVRAGLQGLSLNVFRNKTHRLNNNMAVQHHHQTMICKYWKLWQDRLEEAEDESFQPLTKMALTNHSTSLLSSCFHHWREKLAEQRHMQELEHRADIWFAERMLPLCLDSWVEFTLQRRLHKQRRHQAEVYNQQRQYMLVFYTWWGQSEKHKEQRLSERMAILHEERCHLQRAWTRWKLRTDQQIDEEQKQKASERLYQLRLLHKTMTKLKDNSTETRDRRNREQRACHQGDLRCMRWAVEKWKQFVQSQRVKNNRLKLMQRYYEVKLLKRTFVAWKKHLLQMGQIYGHAEQLYRHQKQTSLRTALCVWRENAVLLTEVRLREQRALNHFQHFLQLKVFVAWRKVTTRAVSKRHQQGEAVIKAQRSINQVRLLRSFRQWRVQTREARRQRLCMEKARRCHDSKLLSKALKAWNNHRNQHQKNKVMKRQGILLLRLKMYQTYFDQWKIKLQHRQREAKQMERALWHWSLSLQAKVLYGWRREVTEQRRKQEQAARAAEVYRDQLLREGVKCILTYAAHMNDLTTSLTQHSQEQRSRRLKTVVKRCAMRWKQRALCKPQREQEVKGQPSKKSVTFCLTTPGSKSVASSDSEEQEAEDGVLSKLRPLSRAPRRQPRRCEELFEFPMKINTRKQTAVTGAESAPKPSEEGHHTASSCLHPVPVASTCQSIIISNVSTWEPQETQNQDVLLPPSAFMTTGAEDTLVETISSGFGDAPLHQFVFKPHSLADSDVRLRASSGETVEDAAADPTLALTGEMLRIQLDMMTYQQDRKQLRAWLKLKEVLQSWLQTSGKDEHMENNAVCQELKELEERIDRLSTDLAKRKPTMLLHAERIQRLQSALQASGVSFLHRKTEEMERLRSVFTT
ncbi:LOW QUALITY PROTEIN: protein SFI1 homolog [Cottoperca gobio]|uniref:LOW QUALITY PROTEIN: protein SFI1 homolog n=1 Tax=Cottoperca gobio TaxID=56716 RepID=A0A6J2PNP3_COTGO|nr:LOW QUALITY PROTEIN: protein SFI1 homolog [Cottoperca gobio]